MHVSWPWFLLFEAVAPLLTRLYLCRVYNYTLPITHSLSSKLYLCTHWGSYKASVLHATWYFLYKHVAGITQYSVAQMHLRRLHLRMYLGDNGSHSSERNAPLTRSMRRRVCWDTPTAEWIKSLMTIATIETKTGHCSGSVSYLHCMQPLTNKAVGLHSITLFSQTNA